MTPEGLERQARLIGEAATRRLGESRVLLFGVGGVGGAALEALVRAGVGYIAAADGDIVAQSNLNRQLIATCETIGMPKVEAAARRAKSIAPSMEFEGIYKFCTADDLPEIFERVKPHFVIDAIDSVTSKLAIAEYCTERGIPLISSMGTGNKLDPTRFEIADISKTSVCPLARVMRRELGKRGIKHLTVLYSKEEPINSGSCTPASISFVPTAAGLIIAGYCIKRLAGIE